MAQIDVLRLLSAAALDLLAASAAGRHYHAGSVVLAQGSRSDSVHAILAGRVRVERSYLPATSMLDPVEAAVPSGQGIAFAELGPGQIFGEMGLLGAAPRSATVTAVQPTTTIEIPADTLERVLRQHPEAMAELRRMVVRRTHTGAEVLRRAREQLSG